MERRVPGRGWNVFFRDDNYEEPSVSFHSLPLSLSLLFIYRLREHCVGEPHCLGRNAFVGRLAALVNGERRGQRDRGWSRRLALILEGTRGRRLNCGSISEKERGHGQRPEPVTRRKLAASAAVARPPISRRTDLKVELRPGDP